MKKILLIIAGLLLLWQCQTVLGKPGVVDSPEIRKRAISTKLSSPYNSIGSNEKLTGEIFGAHDPPAVDDFEPMKITHEDVMASYGSQSPFTNNGGIIFAIGQPSTPLAHPQPVLLQYMSPEGISRHTGIQYVQLLRPVMLVPAQPYQPARSVEIQTESPITSQPTYSYYGSSFKPSNSIIGAHSVPLTSYVQSNAKPLITSTTTESNLDLNMNEYIPAASTRVASFVSPKLPSMTGLKPSVIAQRA